MKQKHHFIIPEGYKADIGTCCICGETKQFLSKYKLEMKIMEHRVFFHYEDYEGRRVYYEDIRNY